MAGGDEKRKGGPLASTNGDDEPSLWDSQCWFPPLELVALVAAGVLPAKKSVLDLGCGAGIEAIFLAKRGWRVFGLDKERSLIAKARALARQHKAPAKFHLTDLKWKEDGLPPEWPRHYDIVLDRMCINNVVDDDLPEDDYYGFVASLLRDGGLYVLRDRGDPEQAEATFRRKLFQADDDYELPSGADKLFELVPNGRVLDVRLVGDDTPDWNRLDAMIPIRGRLAVLCKKKPHGGKRRRATDAAKSH